MSFNASAVVQALPLFDSLPSFPALSGDSAATPATEKAPAPRSPHAQEFALDLQVRLHSLTADLMTDACARVATLSLERLGMAFSQGASSHVRRGPSSSGLLRPCGALLERALREHW